MTVKENKTFDFSSKLLLLSLIILCQPNVNIIDIFPDFIAFFILAKMMGNAALCVPYFDEAKSTFYKLAFLDIFRFFCQFLVFGAANSNTRNDTMALFALSFSVIEYILLFKAIRCTFDGLYYLGERTDCSSLIRPFTVMRLKIKPETLQFLLEIFFGCKALFAMLPDFIRLSASQEAFTMYRTSVFITLGIGFILGVVAVVFAYAYIKAVKAECRFSDSVKALYDANEATSFIHDKKQVLQTAFLFMFVSVIFTVFLPIDTLDGADLFPGFLFPFLFSVGLLRLRRIIPLDKNLFTVGFSLFAISFVSFILRPVYFSLYELTDIASVGSAKALYGVYEGITLVECIATAAFLLMLRKEFNAVIETQTGVPKGSKDYRQTDIDYHNGMKKLNTASTVFGLFTLIAKTVKILTDSQSFYSVIIRDSQIVGSVTMSALPWLGMVINFSAVIYAVLFYYFSSTLKDEWNV